MDLSYKCGFNSQLADYTLYGVQFAVSVKLLCASAYMGMSTLI